MDAPVSQLSKPRTWFGLLFALGVYLTLCGYRSFEGDQAYRLPLLIDRQQPQTYVHDPFVRAFDRFNPHGGYLTVLDAASRLVGLAPALFLLFVAGFLVTGAALIRLGRSLHSLQAAGWITLGLVLTARAGNVGTNHLFEPMLLDRLLALALGWTALAEWADRPRRATWTVPPLILSAQWIHPSLGLQLGLLLGAGWISCSLLGTWSGLTRRIALVGCALLALAMLPALARLPAQSATLFEGLSSDDYFRLAALVQSPQHLVPHLWRLPQWLAWACYPVLAVETRAQSGKISHATRRMAILLGLIYVMLILATWAIEILNDLRVTLFQPFRLATVARGLCLVFLSGRVLALWQRRTAIGWSRAGVLVAGLTSDWAFVVATCIELLATCLEWKGWERLRRIVGMSSRPLATHALAGALPLILATVAGCWFLARHDTHSGQYRLAAGLILGNVVGLASRGWARPGFLSTGRRLRLLAATWALPIAAFLIPARNLDTRGPVAGWVVTHIRLTEQPVDDLERLAVWCREHTPAGARFIGPPGPKGFRLWSRRPVMFNRASSPYHAAGLADWAARFAEHVGLPNDAKALAQAYLANRQALERRYDDLDARDLARLAARQGADHVIARSDLKLNAASPVRLLHRVGRVGVYQVDPAILATHAPTRVQ